MRNTKNEKQQYMQKEGKNKEGENRRTRKRIQARAPQSRTNKKQQHESPPKQQEYTKRKLETLMSLLTQILYKVTSHFEKSQEFSTNLPRY